MSDKKKNFELLSQVTKQAFFKGLGKHVGPDGKMSEAATRAVKIYTANGSLTPQDLADIQQHQAHKARRF